MTHDDLYGLSIGAVDEPTELADFVEYPLMFGLSSDPDVHLLTNWSGEYNDFTTTFGALQINLPSWAYALWDSELGYDGPTLRLARPHTLAELVAWLNRPVIEERS